MRTESLPEAEVDIVMVAAECRGLVKVGGLGDAVADLGRSLTSRGMRVRVVLPFYDQSSPSGLESARSRGTFNVSFEGRGHLVHHYVTFLGTLEVHLLRAVYFTGDYGSVYVNSQIKNRGPFEDDARRFAFFSTAVHALLEGDSSFKTVEVVHGHDWHAGALLWLLKNDPGRVQPKTLFTIHNMEYQGIRPLNGGLGEGVRSWWPELARRLPQTSWEGGLDPRYPGCFNLLRAGITQSDALTTVSPQYAREILLPDDPPAHFYGGRGLESDVRAKQAAGLFSGWVNGLDYLTLDPGLLTPPLDPRDPLEGKSAQKKILKESWQEIISSGDLPDRDFLVQKHTEALKNAELVPGAGQRALVVMVTRITAQKTSLLLEEYQGRKVWEHLLDRDLDLVILGTGDQEKMLLPLGAHPRGHLLRTFQPSLSLLLYGAADLFLMPSDFEPCGISQLMALRYGALPVVHARGGLVDTVKDGETGFIFRGENRTAQILSFLSAVDRALSVISDTEVHHAMVIKAMAERFTWDETTEEYLKLYRSLVQSH